MFSPLGTSLLYVFFFSILRANAVPHVGLPEIKRHAGLFEGQPGPRNGNWAEEAARTAENIRRDNGCPALPAPVDRWLDYSVKTRTATQYSDDSLTCPTPVSLLHRGLDKRDDYSCDENNPCSNFACCAKSGYCGYGEKYCGDGTSPGPNDVCWSNCDAHAPCGRDALVANTTCPLNVCCSEFGFCGTTQDFCGTGCQSNCKQPKPSTTGGDAERRVVAYWESWNTRSNCASCNLGMKTMPAGSLTHLIFSFAYITPDTYQITAMPGVEESMLSSFAKVKEGNPGIKLMISLGGWSFNDNNTDTQPVFTNMIRTFESRKKFIKNLLSFLRQHGLDGVDFDWEYPGAGDRGGHKDDGINYTSLLSELRVQIDQLDKKYVVSFTTPSSYFYLQNFDLSAMMQHVDFTNLMAYDLHGTWDGPKDNIGSIVLAHTNLTEIDNALDLFWRNSVHPGKINLGIGFYGRSFQLADPACWQPGCPFKGGANPGSCTKQSGILSYREIVNVIQTFNVTPYWDQTDAVTYMIWDSDQWVSYDDEDTFRQKIEYASGTGLGGVAIWAIDLDTDDFRALEGLLGADNKTLNAFHNQNVNANYWQDATGGQCFVTDCGIANCPAGSIKIQQMTCQDGLGDVHENVLCCPFDSAPDPSTCTWRGTPPYCNGECHPGEVAMLQNPWGDGSACTDGNYVYCCQVPAGKSTGCRVTGCGGTCNIGEVQLESAGTFKDDCTFPRMICCPYDHQLTDCHWQGEPGSCYDAVCDFNTEIEMAMSYDGDIYGDTCGIQVTRKRVFCCKAPGGQQPFLPVDIKDLFPDPPTGDHVDVSYKLETDNSWGTGNPRGNDDANDAAFGFFVMAAPEEIQVSLDKRDGSHWELLDCMDTTKSEGEQTIRMFCNDDSGESNCHKIHLGHGVPGTILEMPDGCGPGRYAVAKDLQRSQNQSLPNHGHRSSTNPVVYDLTFDYDFSRVPQDLGDVQWRVDYSNEAGYWDRVVEGAGDKRRKRSLEDHGGNHARWLEDAWREDHKHGLVSRSELHARWFGSDVLDWLKGLFSVVTTEPKYSHQVNEDLNVILVDETYDCNFNGVQTNAHLRAEARLSLFVETSFGLTIIAKVGSPVDLSQSYLYFKNKGTIVASFSLDALVQATYDTGDIELFGLESFGATFSVPGILTVGPNFRIFGNVNMDVSMSGKLQAEVVLADWDTHMAFPDQESEADPQSNNGDPGRDGTQGIGSTDLSWKIAASGQITAHVKPTFSFGISFNKKFIPVDPAEVDLVADGWVQFYADGSVDDSGSYSVCYGANSGASLYAQVLLPHAFQTWGFPSGSTLDIYSPKPVALVDRTCPIQHIEPRDLLPDMGTETYTTHLVPHNPGPLSRTKRNVYTLGPLMKLPFALSCPSSVDDETTAGNMSTCPICEGMSPDELELYGRDEDPHDGEACDLPVPVDGDIFCTANDFANAVPDTAIARRSELWAMRYSVGVLNTTEHYGHLDKRVTRKQLVWQYPQGSPDGKLIQFGDYQSCGEAAKNSKVHKWFSEPQGSADCTPNVDKIISTKRLNTHGSAWATEHVFEAQTVKEFWTWLATGADPIPGYTRPSYDWVTSVVVGMEVAGTPLQTYRWQDQTFFHTSVPHSIQGAIEHGFGSVQNPEELTLTSQTINEAKNIWMGLGTPQTERKTARRARQAIRDAVSMFQYLQWNKGSTEAVWDKFMRVSNWIDVVMWNFDKNYPWGTGSYAGEPTHRANTPSLRSLWAYFLEKYLDTIEANAKAWGLRMRDSYKATHNPSNSQADQNWYIAAFGSNGWATATQGGLQFPRVPGGYGKYGVTANTRFMTDAAGYSISIGLPAAIS